jgi:hypothetical protein
MFQIMVPWIKNCVVDPEIILNFFWFEVIVVIELGVKMKNIFKHNKFFT